MKKIILVLVVLGVSAFAEVNTKVCAACHGQHFEKHAMGKSKIVKNMTHAQIVHALLGYKYGTYGGPMKAVMKMQISKYSDVDIKNISIGKKTKVASFVKKKIAKKVKTKKKTFSNVLFSEKEKVAYKEGYNCWVVDYKEKKSNAVACKRLLADKNLLKKGMFPPKIGNIPSPVFQGLFK